MEGRPISDDPARRWFAEIDPHILRGLSLIAGGEKASPEVFLADLVSAYVAIADQISK
jgi:hypothetical protein